MTHRFRPSERTCVAPAPNPQPSTLNPQPPLRVLVITLFSLSLAFAQNPPPPQDPLMSLMMSQPRIEIGAPATAVAWFDPPVAGVGQTVIFRVTFNALEESIEWPAQFIPSSKLDLLPGARGQILQPGMGVIEPRTTFNFHLTPSQTGEFTVPAFTINVYGKPITVPATTLQVVATPPAGSVSAQQLTLEIPNTNLFVGQSATARVLLPSAAGGFVQMLGQVQLTGDGFIVDQGASRQRAEATNRGGINTVVFINELVLTPVAAGKLKIFAQAFTAGNRPPLTTNGVPVPGGPLYTLIESDPRELQVRPLPKEGELPGFTGAIGDYALEAPKLATNEVRVGDPVKLSVTVRSGSGFARLVAPPPPRSDQWQILSATSEGEPAQLLQTHGFATFQYTLVPMSEAAHETPPIPFSFFDPNRSAYVDLSIPSLPVKVVPGRAPPDTQVMAQSEAANSGEEEELSLSGLAASPGRGAAQLRPLQEQPLFPLVQLAPALAFVALWAWDQRRRYLQDHPDILLRRRARRALRRQRRVLRRAARAGDASGFAAAAVDALRAGSAPHLPANPSALVGADVLSCLGQTESPERLATVTSVVRPLFAVTDASRFGTGPRESSGLLRLQPEVERLLEQMEERL